MASQRRLGIILILLLAVVAVILAIAAIFPGIRDYLPLIVSSIALLASLIALFKEDLFSFRLRVLAGDVILLNTQNNPAIDLVLTLTFINKGYVDGVIEFIALKVTNSKGSKKLYVASNELDNKLVFNIIRQTQTSISNSIFFPLSAFPIQSRQSIKKHLGLAWSSASNFIEWEADRYQFELYLKSSRDKKLKKVSEFYHEMTRNDFNIYSNQESYYMAGNLERSLMKQVNEL